MRKQWMRWAIMAPAVMILAWAAVAAYRTTPVEAQGGAGRGAIPRNSWDQKPDLNGIWQAMVTANWDLEDHEGGPSALPLNGTWGARLPGQSVVEGGTIPYKPEALAKRDENRKNALPTKLGRDTAVDPELNCFLPGVPRATYQPHPFQIFMSPQRMWIVYQFSYARREIFMNGKKEPQIDSWMGLSNARWEGDTLVVETTGFNDQTWFDRAGNYHSEALKVTEHYTMIGPDHMNYEATMEDPNVFTRPWKISFPLYRRIEPNVQLLQFRCAEYVEELHYGALVRKEGGQ